ncbi:DUF3653 domain-containing protein [Paenibacillus apiarius]|uniref:DUF3653 domain-containing protein n=1 Tax=Paenibacillus apiarius TaxID=46240 RepID=UPI003B3A692C
MSDIWAGTGIWQGWRLTTDHAASSRNQPVLVSPDGRAFGPGDIAPDRIGHNEFARMIGTSRQALTDRRKRGTVPEPDGLDEKGHPYWRYTTIRYLVDEK